MSPFFFFLAVLGILEWIDAPPTFPKAIARHGVKRWEVPLRPRRGVPSKGLLSMRNYVLILPRFWRELFRTVTIQQHDVDPGSFDGRAP